ncbi:MAG: hypothetical protein HW419_243 [Deltaproteobacteria bacterium]|nr:hypothetical protein [Deltaproteobacteria bacterium]
MPTNVTKKPNNPLSDLIPYYYLIKRGGAIGSMLASLLKQASQDRTDATLLGHERHISAISSVALRIHGFRARAMPFTQ